MIKINPDDRESGIGSVPVCRPVFLNGMLSFRQILAVLILLSAGSCKDRRERVKPSLNPLTESVYASLSVQPAERYYAYATVGGLLMDNLVEESDDVEKGQVLVQIENANPQLNAENARLAYNLAKDNYKGRRTVLGELENQIHAARLKMEIDSVNYLRQKRLYEKDIGSRLDYDTRKLAYEVSASNLLTLQSKYEQTRNQLEYGLRQAENNYKSSLKTTGDYSVKSEMDGRVYELMKEPGEIVTLQEPVAMIGSKDSFLVVMLIDEVDIPRVNLGQKALIRLDAYGKKVFAGRVSKIFPKMDSRTQTFTVEAYFEESPQKLYPGLTGEANIVTREIENALTIPYDYLVGDNQVQTGDGLVEVSVGVKNFERVEILAGLDTNVYIYKPE